MSGFSDQISQFVVKVDSLSEAVLDGCAVETLRSVKIGSELTNAPGQPVDTGNLRNSIQLETLGKGERAVFTNVDYAPAIEAGIGPHGPMALRSEVGGFGSFGTTAANFDRIVEHVVPIVTGQGGAP